MDGTPLSGWPRYGRAESAILSIGWVVGLVGWWVGCLVGPRCGAENEYPPLESGGNYRVHPEENNMWELLVGHERDALDS